MRAFSLKSKAAFSLVEVVIATAVFATAIVAIVGLMGPLSRRVEDVIDSELAARLTDSVQAELSRLGYNFVSGIIDAEDPIYLYATPDGLHVVVGPEPEPDGDENTSTAPALNNNIESGNPRGIAKRDRYFVIRVEDAKVGGNEYDPTKSGSVPVRTTVVWPYRIPTGPASDFDNSGGDASFDPSQLVDETQRQQLVFFFAVTP